VWLTSLFGPSFVSLGALTATPALTRLVASSLIALPLLALLPRALASPQQRFFTLGTLLCLPPLFSTVPQERILLAASFGAFGLLASFMHGVSRTSSTLARGVLALFGFWHLVLSPVSFIPMLDANRGGERGAENLARVLPTATRPAVLLNTPFELIPMYAGMICRNTGGSLPCRLHTLYAGQANLEAERVDDHTLDLTAPRGWGAIEAERVFADRKRLPVLHEQRAMGELTAEVLEQNAAGLPRRVRFRFDTSLDDPSRSWFVWEGASLVRWQVPQVGRRVPVSGASLLRLVAESRW
jgi:hypothetical protein